MANSNKITNGDIMTNDLMTVKQMADEIGCHHTSIRDYIGALGIKPDAVMPTLPMATRLYIREKFDLIKTSKEQRKKGKATSVPLNRRGLQKPETLQKDRPKTYSKQDICFILDRADSVVSRWIKSAHMRPQDDGRYTESQFQRIRALSNKTPRRKSRSFVKTHKRSKPTFWQKLSSNLRAWGVI